MDWRNSFRPPFFFFIRGQGLAAYSYMPICTYMQPICSLYAAICTPLLRFFSSLAGVGCIYLYAYMRLYASICAVSPSICITVFSLYGHIRPLHIAAYSCILSLQARENRRSMLGRQRLCANTPFNRFIRGNSGTPVLAPQTSNDPCRQGQKDVGI